MVIDKYILTCAIITNWQVQAYIAPINRIPEDGRLNFTGLSRKYGYPAEEYDLTSSDGYILKLNHMFGDRKKPVLLLHGALISSDSFVLRGHTSLAITLAREGYDVWALNIRGNRYSRRHVSLNPDEDKQFWDYSLDEIAYYDLPLTIDFILMSTGQEKLRMIAYSQGTTLTFMMASIKPEYNEKISLLVALAPAYFFRNTKSFMSILTEFSVEINAALISAGIVEFGGYYSSLKRVWDDVCTSDFGYQLCMVDLLHVLTGADIDEIEQDFFPVIVGHFPAGGSTKSLYHLVNLGKRKNVGKYDYGLMKNEIVYGSRTPPNYNLSDVTMEVAMFVGQNDQITTMADTELLRKQLPNVVKYHVIERPQFSHIDFVWGRNTYKTLHPHILDTLGRYG